MNLTRIPVLTFLAFVLSTGLLFSQQMTDCPYHSQHQHANSDMTHRGDDVMGFDHTKTTHHFRLQPDGGVIEATANDPKDAESRDKIRAHFHDIARLFADGNFDKPVEIHSQLPPGAETMTTLRADIRYEFVEIENGGQVRITTRNPEALKAIQAFLRFQIYEHRTADPLDL
jgi:hypothetical protein